MISRKVLWFIALAFIGVLGVTWWAGSYPARVVIINQGGTIRNTVLRTGGERFDLGTIAPGETRVVKIPSGDYVSLLYEVSRRRSWQSPEKSLPAQSLNLYIDADGRVELRKRAIAR